MKKLLLLISVIVMFMSTCVTMSYADKYICNEFGHNLKLIIIDEPTCTQRGFGFNKCTYCEFVGETEIPMLGHDVLTVEAVEATCVENGKSEWEKCLRCDVVLKEASVIPKIGHIKVSDEAVSATCVSSGFTSGSHCGFCGEILEKQNIIAKTGHTFNYSFLYPATLTGNGYKVGTCKVCGYESDEIIYSASIFSLSTEICSYDGNVKTPSVIIKDSVGYELVNGRDYIVTYDDGRINPGIYEINVTLIGEYEGTKILTFKILPGKTNQIIATSSQKESINLSWEPVVGAAGYRVYIYETVEGSTRKAIANVTTSFYELHKDYLGDTFAVGAQYKVAVAAYMEFEDGTVFPAIEDAEKVFTRTPGRPTLVVTSAGGKVNLKWTNVEDETGYQVYYATSKDGDYKELTSTIKNSYSHSFTNGETLYFKVRAYTKFDGEVIYGEFSEIEGVKIIGGVDSEEDDDTDIIPPEDTSDVIEPENDPCTCNCHGNFIQRIIFKITNFFAKIFNPSKKICICGVKH